MLFSGTRLDFPAQGTQCSLERPRGAPGRPEHPLPGHLLAFPQGPGQGQGPGREMFPLLGVSFLPRLPRPQNKSLL